MSAEFDFKAYLGKAKERVEAALDGSLGPERPESLREAMRYSLLAGGKRQGGPAPIQEIRADLY